MTLKKLLLTAALFLWIEPTGAQDAPIVAYYPTSANVAKRLLPFLVTNKDRIISIEIQSDEECLSFVDFYFNHIFHIYCYTPTRVSAEVFIEDSEKNRSKLSIAPFEVVKESMPVAELAAPAPTDSENQK